MTDKQIEHFERVERARKREDFRPLVYICSPFADDPEGNTKKARKYSRFAYVNKMLPITPHLMFTQYLSEDTERADGLAMSIVLLGKCDEVWVFGGRVTAGMAGEIAKAKQWYKRIRWFNDDLEEVPEYSENRSFIKEALAE